MEGRSLSLPPPLLLTVAGPPGEEGFLRRGRKRWGTAGPGSGWLCRGTRKLGGGRWERDAELVVGVSGGLSCRYELIFLGDVVRSAPVDLGLPVFSVCFLFSSQTDFIHTIYLAMPARLWSLVLFWQRKFINFSRLPTHFPNVLGEKKWRASYGHTDAVVLPGVLSLWLEKPTISVDTVRKRESPKTF